MAIKLDATADNIELKTNRIQDLENVNAHDEGYPTALAAKLYADKFKVTIDTELSETSENPVQNKVVTATFDKVDIALSRLSEDSNLKDFARVTTLTTTQEVSSVECNFNSNVLGNYKREILVNLVVPPPTQSLAYITAEIECVNGSKPYFISCGGDGSGVVIKPDTGLNFCGGFRIFLDTPYVACLTWGGLFKSTSPYGTMSHVGYGTRKLSGDNVTNRFKKLTLRASGGTSILLPIGTKVEVYAR